MTTTQNAGLLIARILLASMFILAGFGKLGNVEGFAGYMASGGVPAFLAWPVILLEIGGGIAILIGLFARPAALALAAFCLASGLLYHYVPGDQAQMTAFMKNVSLAGGYLALALFGAGQWSVDAMIGGKSRSSAMA